MLLATCRQVSFASQLCKPVQVSLTLTCSNNLLLCVDLEMLEEADITALKKQLKKVQAIKFQTKLSDVLSKLRQQEAAAEGEDYDRYWQ